LPFTTKYKESIRAGLTAASKDFFPGQEIAPGGNPSFW